MGRSISTLMSDKAFHEVAYRAHSRGQLLSAINEFLNDSIVFPPSDWNNKDLVPIDDIREKSKEIIKKNESMRKKKMSEMSKWFFFISVDKNIRMLLFFINEMPAHPEGAI